MNTLAETSDYLQTISETLHLLDSQRDVFQFLIDLGQEVQPLTDTTQATLVPGCLSKVWIKTEIIDTRVQILGVAEALIVKGYVAILIQAFSGLTIQDLKQTQPIIQEFIHHSKISHSILPTRSNAFASIYEVIFDSAVKSI